MYKQDQSTVVRFLGVAGAIALGASVVGACSKEGAPSADAKAADAKAADAKVADAKAADAKVVPVVAAAADAQSSSHARFSTQLWGGASQPCAELTPGSLFHGITGIDACPRAMSDEEKSQLHDPWAEVLLRPGAPMPTDFESIVNTATTVHTDLHRHSVLLGEGSQLTDAPDHDVRFIVTWGDEAFKSASLFFSARPSPAAHTLEVIAFDSVKQKLNFYHYTGVNDQSTQKTWVYAGDSSDAQNPQARANGCFACHLDGTMNMKELTTPWNNWHSSVVRIVKNMIPDQGNALVSQLYDERQDAYNFEPIIRDINKGITQRRIHDATHGAPLEPDTLRALLTPLFEPTTINLASASAHTGDPIDLPNDAFMFDTAFRDPEGINLHYGPGEGKRDLAVPTNLGIQMGRPLYERFIGYYEFRLVDTDDDGNETFSQPGGTFFPFFEPTAPYEDAVAISALISNNVISPKFAASVLMVDFQNAVFSERRAELLANWEIVPPLVLDGHQIPQRMAELLQTTDQGSCDPTAAVNCSPAQEFSYWWSLPDDGWKAAMEARLSRHIDVMNDRLANTSFVFEYMISLRTQFSHYPDICNLDEFPLLLPKTNLGDRWMRLLGDGTFGPKDPYTGCP